MGNMQKRSGFGSVRGSGALVDFRGLVKSSALLVLAGEGSGRRGDRFGLAGDVKLAMAFESRESGARFSFDGTDIFHVVQGRERALEGQR